MRILDIPGKRFEPDLGRFKPHLGGTPQPSGIVRDPHHPQRRRMIAAGRPRAERFERLDRWPHQGRGAVVDAAEWGCDQHGGYVEMRKCKRRHQARGAAADHRSGGGVRGGARRCESFGFGVFGHRTVQ